MNFTSVEIYWICLNSIALAMIVASVFLFRRERRLVHEAGEADLLPHRYSFYLWIHVKLLSWFNRNRKAPEDVFEEYRKSKDVIQSVMAFWIADIVWMLFFLWYVTSTAIDLTRHFEHGGSIGLRDEAVFVVASLLFLFFGHSYASRMRHSIKESTTRRLTRDAGNSPSDLKGFSASPKSGEFRTVARERNAVLPMNARARIERALESRENSLQLLKEAGLVNSNNEMAEPYRESAVQQVNH
jgi:hypothetical protein